MKSKKGFYLVLFTVFNLLLFCQCKESYIKLTAEGSVYNEEEQPLKGILVTVVCKIDTLQNHNVIPKDTSSADSLGKDTLLPKPYASGWIGDCYTDKEGKYRISLNSPTDRSIPYIEDEYWWYWEDVVNNGVCLIAKDTSGVYESDTIIKPKMWKTERGDRHDGEYKGAYRTQYKFTLKKKK